MTRSTDVGSPVSEGRRAYVGPCLVLVCMLHVVVGAVDAAPLLADAIRDGWAGAFTGERTAVLWFLMTGVVGAVTGVAVTVVERSGRMPWTISIALLVAAVLGVSMAPVSGFVLVLAVAILAVARSLYLPRSRTDGSPA